MSLSDLLPSLEALPRAEKLQAIRFLTEKLMEEDKLLAYFQPGGSYPVWSPYDSYEAAAVIHRMLESDENSP
jgi:hypothetical protein